MTATKNFRVNSFIAGLAIKAPCKSVSSANLTLSGEQTVNGVPCVSGDRVLVKDQADPTENGIYNVESSAWGRSGDWDGNRDVVQGTMVPVVSGPGGVNLYEITTANPIEPGTTSVAFELRYGANVRYDRTQEEIDAGATPVNYGYDPGEVPRYGDIGATALGVAISVNAAGGPPVEVVPGNYEKVDISTNDVALNVHRGAVFTLPDNDITGVDTSGTPALEISGNNVTINGHVYCDGNKASQTVSGFAADERSATFKVSGDDFIMNGTVEVVDAFWDGVTIDGGDAAGQEVLRTTINTIKVKDAHNRSATMWGAKNYNIERFIIEAETAANGDHRLRVGTNSVATSVSMGRIGNIDAPGQLVVIEEGTELFEFDSAKAASLKTEAANNVIGGICDVRDIDDGASLSFGVIGGSNIALDQVITNGHGGSAAAAVSFEDDFVDVRIGYLYVDGSVNTAGGARVRAGVGLKIGETVLNNNADYGLHVDQSVAYTQSDFRFGYIRAEGNGGVDVNFESGIDRASFGYIERNPASTYAGVAAAQNEVKAFAAADATPSVADGRHFRTADATTITDLDDGIVGQEVFIHVDHAVTFDVTGTDLTGNGGVDIVAAAGDVIYAITQDGTTWVLDHWDAA